MSGKKPDKTDGKIPTELSKDDLLKYVELDLGASFRNDCGRSLELLSPS